MTDEELKTELEKQEKHNALVGDTWQEVYDNVFSDYPELYNILESKNALAVGYGGPITSLGFSLSRQNRLYTSTQYYYDTNNKDFIHFTSLNSLLSIIENRCIKLYTLDNANDPNEIDFISKKYKNLYEYRELKKEIFSFSFSKKNCQNDLNLWRFYGLEGKGIGIIFGFVNTPDKWRNFHLSEIFYGNCKEKKRIDNLNKALLKYNKNKLPISSNLNLLYGFHKPKAFNEEKEVRLIFYSQYDTEKQINKSHTTYSNSNIKGKQHPLIQKSFSKYNEVVRYLSLPLLSKFNDEVDEHFLEYSPQIKIKGVALGFQISKKKENATRVLIQSYCKEYLGYEISDEDIKIPRGLRNIFR